MISVTLKVPDGSPPKREFLCEIDEVQLTLKPELRRGYITKIVDHFVWQADVDDMFDPWSDYEYWANQPDFVLSIVYHHVKD